MRDQLSGLFWLAISIFVCVEAINSSIGTFQMPGPGFFPFWLGVALGIFSITLIVASILRKKDEEKIRSLWKGRRWVKLIFVFATLVVYAVFLPSLGYLVATFGLMILLLGAIERSRLWVKVMVAFATASVTYIVFDLWLEVQLPKGIFGF